MRIIRNPNRITELLTKEKADQAIVAIEKLQQPRVFKALAIAWGILLTMVLTLILTVQVAFWLGELLRYS